jgi:hypothetical protein
MAASLEAACAAQRTSAYENPLEFLNSALARVA